MPEDGAASSRARRRQLLGWIATGLSGLATSAPAAAQQRQGGAGAGPRRPPRYAAPDAKAPRTLVAAASRGASGGSAPGLAVLAPRQTGLALAPRPTLYWFLDAPPPTGAGVELSVIEEQGAATEPLLERDVSALSARGGIVGLTLPSVSALRPGVEYRWAVRVAVDPASPSRDALSSGTIRLAAAPPAGVPPAGPTPSLDRAERLAAAGFWYDCLAELSALVAERPSDRGWREARAGFLEQEDHAAAAAWDRGQGR